jgi:hypothetical protein
LLWENELSIAVQHCTVSILCISGFSSMAVFWESYTMDPKGLLKLLKKKVPHSPSPQPLKITILLNKFDNTRYLT